MLHFVRNWLRNRPSRSARVPRRPARLALESLEERCVLSTTPLVFFGGHAYLPMVTSDAGLLRVLGNTNFDVHSSLVTIDSPPNGLFFSTNVAITGRLTTPTLGLLALQVQVDAGNFVNVSVNPDQSFSFARSFPLDGTGDGTHTVNFRVTDMFGNALNSTTSTYTLDTVSPTTTTPFANITTVKGATPINVPLLDHFNEVDSLRSIVRFYTALGSFDVQLFDTQTPQTVANFLNYVNRHGNGGYDGSVINRSIPGFVIQGGGFDFVPGNNPNLVAIPTDAPVKNEPGLSNVRGTIAMAKRSGGTDPANSATDQWFINLANNATLDTQNGGFTVFGSVLGDGMNVVDQIAALPTPLALSNSVDPNFTNIPLRNFPANGNLQNATADNLVVVTNLNVIRSRDVLTYQVNVLSGSQAFVNAVTSISGDTLTVNPSQIGTATIQILATDKAGHSVISNSFTITVNPAPPSDITLSNSTITAAQPVGTTVGILNTVDPNASQTFTYTLTGTNANLFTVSTVAGVSTLQTNTVFAVGAPTTFSLGVHSVDSLGLAVDKTFTITVNPAPPTAVTLSNSTITAAQPVGTAVGILNTIDPNANQTFTYTLIGPNANLFTVSTVAGVSTLQTNTVFAVGVPTPFNVTIHSVDLLGLSVDQTISITVNPAPPTDITLSNSTIMAGQPSGTTVGTFNTVDPNANQTFTYTLTGPNANLFTVTGNTLNTNAVLVVGPITLGVHVVDTLGLSFDKQLTITVT